MRVHVRAHRRASLEVNDRPYRPYPASADLRMIGHELDIGYDMPEALPQLASAPVSTIQLSRKVTKKHIRDQPAQITPQQPQFQLDPHLAPEMHVGAHLPVYVASIC